VKNDEAREKAFQTLGDVVLGEAEKQYMEGDREGGDAIIALWQSYAELYQIALGWKAAAQSWKSVATGRSK